MKIKKLNGYYTYSNISFKDEVFKYICDNNIDNILDNSKNIKELKENIQKTIKLYGFDYFLERCAYYDYAITDNEEFANSDDFKELCLEDTAFFDAKIYFV
ncbi:hypothetical protein [Campylobacter sp. MG1]|uniref:hypothetical protein n=1 Tax=Campylobacter sp. MG1 TaxID=2976332 RepID=UPI00226CD2D2|nr:hypothetical protein [Campylobacter sp. MG1]